MPDNYSVAIETGGYRLLELFAERCGDDAAVTITDGDGHQIASHVMPVAERSPPFLDSGADKRVSHGESAPTDRAVRLLVRV